MNGLRMGLIIWGDVEIVTLSGQFVLFLCDFFINNAERFLLSRRRTTNSVYQLSL